MTCILLCGLFPNVCAARVISDEASGIQAIREAPDPSAVVQAFASASAVAPNDSNVIGAYVNRMVDLGLPEIAYHQAQALATMEPENGLAWAVVAYVDARRNDMGDAATALEKAARYSPDNAFVQRAAGGIVAWSETGAGSTGLSPSDAEALAAVKSALSSRQEFTTAYNAAKAGYAGAAQPGGVEVPSGSPQAEVQPGTVAPYPAYPDYANPNPDYSYAYPDYGTAVLPDGYGYSNYYGDWEPWWEPPGYFYGSVFFPIGPVFGFRGHDFFADHNHHGFDHDRFIARGGFQHRFPRSFAGNHTFASHGFPHSGFQAWGRSSATGLPHGFHGAPGLRAAPRTFAPAWSGRSSYSFTSRAPRFSQHSFGSTSARSFAARPGVSHGTSGGAAGGFHGGHAMGGGGFHGGGSVGHGGGFGGGGRDGGRR